MKAVFLLLLSVPILGSDGVSVSVEVPGNVSGTVGHSVLLPCTFTFPYTSYTTFEISVIWKVKMFYKGPVLFNSTNRVRSQEAFENVIHTNVNDRYRLAGDPRESNASLELRNATLEDNSQYFCRVEIKRKGLPPYMQETNPGVTLKITGPPTVLNMSIQAINDTQFTLVCLVRGEPPPNIVWIDPQNNSFPVNGSNTPVRRGPGKYQVVGELHGPKLGGNYTCKATNNQGNITHIIYFTGFSEGRVLLKVIIGVLIGSLLSIILIVIALVMWRRKSGSITFNRETKRHKPESTRFHEVKEIKERSIEEMTCAVPESPPEVNNERLFIGCDE
ncbi:sialic acid-binding Ig-like lectin 15 [Mustelus asterias]